ncbi:putative Ig domain-containing protein, partial [Escherichia coli]|uniref:putative Ig domain-containing protein n=1 Tax=Escherichia coli TaxID=562 RepID=UPI0013B3E964
TMTVQKFYGNPRWDTFPGLVGSAREAELFSYQISATGNGPVSYSIIDGELPPGLSMTSAGLISGMATSMIAIQTYQFVVRATDG